MLRMDRTVEFFFSHKTLNLFQEFSDFLMCCIYSYKFIFIFMFNGNHIPEMPL